MFTERKAPMNQMRDIRIKQTRRSNDVVNMTSGTKTILSLELKNKKTKKLISLTFLCAHTREVGHGRYNKSAQRAESVWSHDVCGWKAARCRLHNSRKFIWLTVLAGLQHGKASIRVSHPEESAPCFNSAHTHANSSTPMSHFLCTVALGFSCAHSPADSQETPLPVCVCVVSFDSLQVKVLNQATSGTTVSLLFHIFKGHTLEAFFFFFLLL